MSPYCIMPKFKGFCLRCKAKKFIDQAKLVKTKQGRDMVKGICPTCGTRINTFIKAAKGLKRRVRKK